MVRLIALLAAMGVALPSLAGDKKTPLRLGGLLDSAMGALGSESHLKERVGNLLEEQGMEVGKEVACPNPAGIKEVSVAFTAGYLRAMRIRYCDRGAPLAAAVDRALRDNTMACVADRHQVSCLLSVACLSVGDDTLELFPRFASSCDISRPALAHLVEEVRGLYPELSTEAKKELLAVVQKAPLDQRLAILGGAFSGAGESVPRRFYGEQVRSAWALHNTSGEATSEGLTGVLRPVFHEMGCRRAYSVLPTMPMEMKKEVILKECKPGGLPLLPLKPKAAQKVPIMRLLMAMAVEYDARMEGIEKEPLHKLAVETLLAAPER